MSNTSAFRATGTEEGRARIAELNAGKLANVKTEAKMRSNHLLTVISLLENATVEFGLWQRSIMRASYLEDDLKKKYEPTTKPVVEKAQEQAEIIMTVTPYLAEAMRSVYDSIQKWEVANVSETMYNMVQDLHKIYGNEN